MRKLPPNYHDQIDALLAKINARLAGTSTSDQIDALLAQIRAAHDAAMMKRTDDILQQIADTKASIEAQQAKEKE